MGIGGLYFEGFLVGQELRHAWQRTVTESDNLLFCAVTLNVPPPTSLPIRGAERVRKPIVNSLLTMGLLVGMMVNETTLGPTVANLDMTDVTFPKPVFHGDTSTL